MSVQGTGKVGDKLRESQQRTRARAWRQKMFFFTNIQVKTCRNLSAKSNGTTNKQGKKNIGADTCHWKTDLQSARSKQKKIDPAPWLYPQILENRLRTRKFILCSYENWWPWTLVGSYRLRGWKVPGQGCTVDPASSAYSTFSVSFVLCSPLWRNLGTFEPFQNP